MPCTALTKTAPKCTRGVKYREVHEDGSVTGGPFKYLPIAFKKFGKWPGRVLTGIFAISILIFGIAGGNMFQANQTFAQMQNVTGGDAGFLGSAGAALTFGLILSALVAMAEISTDSTMARWRRCPSWRPVSPSGPPGFRSVRQITDQASS